ncbi:uncharacterized protein [Typha angustifolia]|uniref:uncharacterized protein isoform X2 n=1 Tax=Typha angustifolia TaxID=59011 RepID=UPI003C2F6525
MNRVLRRESPVHGRNAAVASLRQGKPRDESLDLFPRFQRSQSTASHNKSRAQNGTLGKSGMGDIFSAEVVNNDNDCRLLTPTGTPGDHHHLSSSATPKCNPRVRSVSASKSSGLSVTRQENPNPTKPIRSNSVTRSSISSTYTSYTTQSTHLTTSSSSVTSKPSPTPTKPAPRPSSPARTRQTPTVSRPCTPDARSKTPSTAPATRSSSRPSTPTRRSPTPTASSRRPSSPVMRTAERAVSTGKQRERVQPLGAVLSSSGYANGRGGSQRNLAKAQVNGGSAYEAQKAAASDVGGRRSLRPASPTDSNGFGRTISKKSLDVAVKHMDIKQGMGGIRGASIFPHSIRSSSVAAAPIVNKAAATTRNTTATDVNRSPERPTSESGSTDGNVTAARVRGLERDIYESVRYDSILLKEDSKNLSWLHSVDDVSVESPLFHRFEPVPEPFGIL